jgi:hypothetical protein
MADAERSRHSPQDDCNRVQDPSDRAACNCAEIGRTQRARIAELESTLETISAIRDSIVGGQTINWSEHIYPLVAALDAAGFPGAGYEISRKNLGTLLERAAALESALQPLADAADYVEAGSGKLDLGDNVGLWTPYSNVREARGITLGDARRARAALTKGKTDAD